MGGSPALGKQLKQIPAGGQFRLCSKFGRELDSVFRVPSCGHSQTDRLRREQDKTETDWDMAVGRTDQSKEGYEDMGSGEVLKSSPPPPPLLQGGLQFLDEEQKEEPLSEWVCDSFSCFLLQERSKSSAKLSP